MRVLLPMFYADPQGRVMLSASGAAAEITLTGKTPDGHRLSEKIVLPPQVVDLITALAGPAIRDESGVLRGMGLTYSEVITVLESLRRSGTIRAGLVF